MPFQQSFPYIGLPNSGSRSVNSTSAGGSGSTQVSPLQGGKDKPAAPAHGSGAPADTAPAQDPDSSLPPAGLAGAAAVGLAGFGGGWWMWSRRRRGTSPAPGPGPLFTG